MLLSNEFLSLLDEQVRNQLDFWKKTKPTKKAEKIWNYENAADFWYGHITGMIFATAVHLFEQIYKRKPSVIEANALMETINKYNEDFQTIFHFKNDL